MSRQTPEEEAAEICAIVARETPARLAQPERKRQNPGTAQRKRRTLSPEERAARAERRQAEREYREARRRRQREAEAETLRAAREAARKAEAELLRKARRAL